MDFGVGVAPRDLRMLAFLYEHVEHLAILVGTPADEAIPWAAWGARSRAYDPANAAMSEMLDCVAGEVLRYLAPRYRAALVSVRRFFDESLTIAHAHPALAAVIMAGLLADDALDALFEEGQVDLPYASSGASPPYARYESTFAALGLPKVRPRRY